MNRELIYDTLFQLLQSKLQNIAVTNEPVSIPDSPYQYIVDWGMRFVSDISVVDRNGVVFTKINSGTPGTNQYIVNGAGTYTFSAADVGRNIYISYNFTGIITASRRLMHWNDVLPTDQPAMFLVKKSERNDKRKGIEDRWTLFFELYIYVNTTNDPLVIPSTLMNPILDQVDSMFSPDDPEDCALTLKSAAYPDGLVSHVAINGDVITDEGVLGDQAISVIPIEVLVPT